MDANYNLIKDYFNKNISDNLEFDVDLNKSKKENYIDFDTYSDIVKYLNNLHLKFNLKLEKYDILDINYTFNLNSKVDDESNYPIIHRISIINSKDKTIDFYVKKYEHKSNSDIFKILSKLILSKNNINNENLLYYIKKRHGEYLDFNDYNVRVRCRTEEKPDIILEEFEDSNFEIRKKQRLTLFLNNDVKIELSDVKRFNNFQDIANNDYKGQSYELEFDYFLKNKKDNKIDEYLPLIIKKANVLLKMINNTNFLIPQQERAKIIENLNKTMKTKNKSTKDKDFTLPSAVVVTLERKHLYQVLNKYMLSYKIDGIRSFLFISETKVYILLSNNKIIFSGLIVDKKYNNTILDGEYVYLPKYGKFIFMVFDALFISGEDLRNEKLVINRMMQAIEVIKDCFLEKESKFTCFDYKNNVVDQNKLSKLYLDQLNNSNKHIIEDLIRYKKNNIKTTLIRPSQYLDVKGFSNNEIFKYANMMWNNYKKNINSFPYLTDGIIFQPKIWTYKTGGIGITQNQVLKWKPKERNTIDFYIEFEKDSKTNDILTVIDNTQNIKNVDDDNEESITVNKPYCICNLYVYDIVNGNHKPVRFDPHIKNENHDKYIAYLPLDDNNIIKDQDNNIITDKTIVEFYYDKDKITDNDYFRWIPVKNRYDKTTIMRTQHKKYGNAASIAYSNWISMMYPVTDSDLTKLADDKYYNNEIEKLTKSVQYIESVSTVKNTEEKFEENNNKPIINSTLYYVNQFINLVKTMLINTYNSNKFDNKKKDIIDIGIGNGMDIYKYYDAEVNSMICLDNNYNNFTDQNGALARYKKAMNDLPNFPTTKFLNADITIPFNEDDQINFIQNTSTENIKNMKTCFNKKYDCINILNTMEYLLKDEESFKNLCDNINKITKENSIIIIITHDAELINNNLKDNEYNIDIYKNNQNINLYSIVKQYDSTQKIFIPGSLIEIKNSYVNDNYYEEFLVDKNFIIPEFEKKCNLKLLETDIFSNVYENIKNYILMSSDIDSNEKTKKFFNTKIKGIYNNSEESEKCKNIIFMNRYYVFVKDGKK